MVSQRSGQAIQGRITFWDMSDSVPIIVNAEIEAFRLLSNNSEYIYTGFFFQVFSRWGRVKSEIFQGVKSEN